MRLLHASGVTDRGHVRSTNEDCFRLDDEHGLAVLADGMGGHKAGEVAARLAVDAVSDYVRGRTGRTDWPFGFDRSVSSAANVLRTAIHVANLQILKAAAGSVACTGMGTTIVAALVQPGGLAVAHVGDSRFYLFRRGRLELLTHDDTWAGNPHVLTNVLGARPHVEVHAADAAVEDGVLALLTTDGVHGTLDDDEMAGLITAGGQPGDIARRLVGRALGLDSRDNCTAVVLRPS